MEQKNRFVIGMDGGGTKTAAMIADVRGVVVAEASGGPSNFQAIGVERAAEVLFELAQECCRKARCELGAVGSLVAGLTGAGRPGDQQRMCEGFEQYARRNKVLFDGIAIESDARVALEGAFRGNPGIILIAGTGSIAFGKDLQGNIHRAGGWGRMLGDEGSGYAIGRDGLNAVTRALDGRGKQTSLAKLVAERFGLIDQEKIITAVYRESFDIASIAPLVMEAASRRDRQSERIVSQAADELCELLRPLTFKLNSSSKNRRLEVSLALIGTIAGGENALSKLLRRKIASTFRQIKVVMPEAPPAYGAVLLALKLEAARSAS